MHVSVVICTWNRAALLDQTLASMHALRVSDGTIWELLVVNNNCSDDTDSVIARHATQLPIRRLFEPTPGKSHAANLAVKEAAGELLLWTDDDVLIEPNWMAAYIRAARTHRDAAFFGGPVEPWFSAEPPRWMRRHFAAISIAFATRRVGLEMRPMGDNEYPYGVNLATRRSAFDGVAYDVRVGPKHKSEVRGEDVLLVDAFRQRGLKGLWVGTATLQHYIPPERLTLQYVRDFYAGLAKTARRLESPKPVPMFCGLPRWALAEYATQATAAALLSPFKTRRWIEAVKRAARARGILEEARIHQTHPDPTGLVPVVK